jgi:hypothetical protein
VVANYILPHRHDGSLLNELPNDFHEKQLRGKFMRTGVILSFALMLATNAELIDEHVAHHYCRPTSANHPVDIAGAEAKEELPCEDSFQSASMLSELPLHNDSNLTPQRQRTASSLLDSEPQKKQTGENEEDDLDILIGNRSQGRVVVSPPPQARLIEAEEKEEVWGVEGVGDVDSGAQLQVEQGKKLRHSNSRDYSLLKLDSDQGRQEPEEIDARLGKEEMALIEEENSVRETVRLPFEARGGQVRAREREGARGREGVVVGVEEKSSMIGEAISFKRVIALFVLAACVFLLAAAYRYNLKKGRSRPRSR